MMTMRLNGLHNPTINTQSFCPFRGVTGTKARRFIDNTLDPYQKTRNNQPTQNTKNTIGIQSWQPLARESRQTKLVDRIPDKIHRRVTNDRCVLSRARPTLEATQNAYQKNAIEIQIIDWIESDDAGVIQIASARWCAMICFSH